jgi:hypothetical protein
MNRLVGMAALLTIGCAAQQFEVASIRLNKSDNRAGTFEVSPVGDRLSARMTTVRRAAGVMMRCGTRTARWRSWQAAGCTRA